LLTAGAKAGWQTRNPYSANDQIAAVGGRNRDARPEDGNWGLRRLLFRFCDNRCAKHRDDDNRNECRPNYSAVRFAICAVKWVVHPCCPSWEPLKVAAKVQPANHSALNKSDSNSPRFYRLILTGFYRAVAFSRAAYGERPVQVVIKIQTCGRHGL
jgi:hypothetical protein